MKAVIKDNTKYYKQESYTTTDSFIPFVVPNTASEIKIECGSVKTGGNGGLTKCTLAVTAGQTLYFYIGSTSNSDYYNATDIRTDNTGVVNSTSLQSRLVVAGGAGWNGYYGGANGGGLVGGNATATGGTQIAGGTGHHGGWGDGADGTFGLGGASTNGGHGGAGWYGGGGGGCDTGQFFYQYLTTGGAGGSSYTHPDLCSDVEHTQGGNTGAGFINIEYQSDASDYTYSVIDMTAKIYEKNNTWKAFK